ncbi:MAG: tripartite tricarboxylate transporter substrate-binding protein, partial [Burkholderiales bacterium]
DLPAETPGPEAPESPAGRPQKPAQPVSDFGLRILGVSEVTRAVRVAGVQLLHVGYKGGAPVMTALLSGEVPVSFSTLPTVLPFRANGKLRVVAVTGARRSPFAPDIPTVSESIRGYEVTQWYGVLAPARTESGIVSTLNSEIVKAVARDNTRQHFASSGATATSTTPAAFRQLIQNEIQKYRKVFASSSIKLD